MIHLVTTKKPPLHGSTQFLINLIKSISTE